MLGADGHSACAAAGWEMIEQKPISANLSPEWLSLDDAAKANLSPSQLSEYVNYRQELFDSEMEWADAEPILRGFIWGCVES